jgi:hypothetical protein
MTTDNESDPTADQAENAQASNATDFSDAARAFADEVARAAQADAGAVIAAYRMSDRERANAQVAEAMDALRGSFLAFVFAELVAHAAASSEDEATKAAGAREDQPKTTTDEGMEP